VGEKIRARFYKIQEKLPDTFGHWGSCLSRIIALKSFPVRFPHSGAKLRAK